MKSAKWWLLLFVMGPVLFWYIATPWVSFHYSEKGKVPLRFFMFTPHEKYSDMIPPGQARGGPGQIFPHDNFFMQADWPIRGGYRCVKVRPKWPTTHVYIDADGEIDKSPGGGTDVDRLSECPHE